MDLLTREELLFLIDQKNGQLVSIYVPTYMRGTDSLQNPTRFKNLIKKIKKVYCGEELVNLELNRLLKKTDEFIDNYEFWQHQSECLAVFLSRDLIKYYCLPIKFEEFFSVGKNFYVIPLINYLNSISDFYILYLSQKEITLYSVENSDLNKINNQELTKITNEELGTRDFQRELQYFTGAGAGARKDSMYYGTGAKDIKIDKYLLNFFHKVDKAIRKTFIDQRPLILAGADYIFPIYREANTYPWIIEDEIHGNPEKLNKKEILNNAYSILNSHNRKIIENKYIKLLELKNTKLNRYSSDLEVIINNSYYGKVDELFILDNKKIWGKYKENSNKIEMLDEMPALDKDELLNIAAINTLINGGNVYILDDIKKIYKKQIAARFRY